MFQANNTYTPQPRKPQPNFHFTQKYKPSAYRSPTPQHQAHSPARRAGPFDTPLHGTP